MTFENAVKNVPQISSAYQKGLQALRKSDKEHVDAARPKSLGGSLDLEAALRKTLPNDPVWDYGVSCFSAGGRNDETVYWIEVHPAKDSEINALLKKLQWLKNWLTGNAKSLTKFSTMFIWISSGKTGISPTSPQAKRIASKGLTLVGSHFKIQ